MESTRKSYSEAENTARTALRRGDWHQTLSILMEVYGQRVRRYCSSLVKDPVLAEDVQQVTFIQAWLDLHRFSGRTSFRVWLYSIAHNRCMDALKASRSWRKYFSAHDELPEQADPVPSADERLIACAAREVLQQCLHCLPPRIRNTLLLRYQEGLSYEEMAEICQERAVTLRVRVARTLPMLRRLLEAHGVRP